MSLWLTLKLCSPVLFNASKTRATDCSKWYSVASPFKSDKWFQKYFQVHKCALACVHILTQAFTYTHTHTQSLSNHKHTLPHSLKRKSKTINPDTQRSSFSPGWSASVEEDEHSDIFVFILFPEKKACHMAEPGNRWRLPTSWKHKRLSPQFKEPLKQENATYWHFSTNCYCYGPEGNSNNETMQSKCFSVQ